MLRVQETIDTEQRMPGNGFISKVTAKFRSVPRETEELLAVVKAHTLSLQQSASNADGATNFLRALTDKNLRLFKKHLVAGPAEKSKKLDPDSNEADSLLADYLVTSFGDEMLAKAFAELDGAKELLAAQKVQSIVFRKWAADGKEPHDIISLLKITDDVELFEPQVTNFLLKFGKVSKDREFSMDDVNAAIYKHLGANPARHISGIWQWEAKAKAKLGNQAKLIAGSQYHWVLRHLASVPATPDFVYNALTILQTQQNARRFGRYIHLTDDEMKKVAEDYVSVQKLVSGEPLTSF